MQVEESLAYSNIISQEDEESGEVGDRGRKYKSAYVNEDCEKSVLRICHVRGQKYGKNLLQATTTC